MFGERRYFPKKRYPIPFGVLDRLLYSSILTEEDAMRIRRTTSIIVLSLMTAFFLAACGGGGDGGGGGGGAMTPVTTTLAAFPITIDNATLNGTVNPNGDNTVAWFEWGTGSGLSPFTPTPNQTLGSGTAAITVTFKLTSLTPGTTYYYRVAASSSAGTVKGTIASFTTAAPNTPPAVQTLAASNLTISGATLNGSVIPNGLATNAHFEWGTDNTFAIPNVTPDQAMGSDSASHLMDANLTGLTAGTKYYFRVVANNSAGTSTGTTASFTTNALSPAVTTDNASPVTTSNATLNGTVNPNGLATTYWFVWGTDPALTNPATISETPHQSLAAGLAPLPINASVSTAVATQYYYRVAANNSAGTSLGSIKNFTTPQNPPPTADAGPDQAVFMMGAFGPTEVTLDGSGSADGPPGSPYGTITSYKWTQLPGGTAVTLDNDASPTPTFTAPAVSYGTGEELQFSLTVTDDRGLSGTDNVNVTAYWGYFDDFRDDTTGSYSVDDFGTGAGFAYALGGDPPGGRVYLGTRDGNSISVFHNFSVPVSYTGVFSIDFCPIVESSPGGQIQLRLMDDNDTYFLVTNSKVSKVRATVEVDSAPITNPYSQGGCYTIKITYSPEVNTFEVFGETISLTTDTTSIGIFSFDITLTDQDAYIDNIKMEAAP